MALQLTKVVQVAPPFRLYVPAVLGTRNTAKLPARPFSDRLETRSFTSKLPPRPFSNTVSL